VTGDAPDSGWWAPIVYARTRDVDVWWRALPPQMRRDGPESLVLDATVAGDGVREPRYVLARLASGTLLGVACQTHQISDDMRHGRPVPCFIGWLSTDNRVAVPQFDVVNSRWVTWAAFQYETWLRPVWTEIPSRVRETDQTRPLRPPWELTGTVPDAAPWDRSEFEEPTRGVRVYPADAAARVWRGIDRYGVNAVVVTGWRSVRTALQRGLTHACVAEFEGAPQIYQLPPDKPAEEATYGKPSAEPGRGRGVSRVPEAGYTAAHDQQETSGRSGWLGGLVSHGKRAVGDLAASVLGGDSAPVQPPDPPTGQSEWTLRLDQRIFTARRGGYLFSYRIGDPAIVCWHDSNTGEAFQWTSAGWVPLTPSQPLRPEPYRPTRRQQRPEQAVSGWQSPGVAPPKAAGRSPGGSAFRPQVPTHSPAQGTPLDEFEDAPLPESQPVLPADEPSIEQSVPDQEAPAQTTHPE